MKILKISCIQCRKQFCTWNIQFECYIFKKYKYLFRQRNKKIPFVKTFLKRSVAIVALISKFKHDHQKGGVSHSKFIYGIYFHHKVEVNMYATKALLRKISYFLGSSKNIIVIWIIKMDVYVQKILICNPKVAHADSFSGYVACYT